MISSLFILPRATWISPGNGMVFRSLSLYSFTFLPGSQLFLSVAIPGHPSGSFSDSPDCSCSLLFLSVALSGISGSSFWIPACICSRHLQRLVFQGGIQVPFVGHPGFPVHMLLLSFALPGTLQCLVAFLPQLHDLDYLPQDPCIPVCSETLPYQFPGPDRSIPPSNSSGLHHLMTECMSSGSAYTVCHRYLFPC